MNKRNLLVTTSAAICVMTPSIASAQTTASNESGSPEEAGYENSGEIVVTARKRSERLIDIPETITAISADTISRAGINSVDDVQQQTPNILINQRGDNEPNVVIRGVGAFGNTQGVGFYVDDVQNFTDQTMPIEDVERIEILKGPQGTLYGGSNIGGAVKFYLKRPGEEPGGEAKVEYGSFDSLNTFLAYDARVSDEFGVRVSGYYNRSDGFITDSIRNTHLDKSEEWGIRVAADWTPSDVFDAQLTFRHNETNMGGNIYIIADSAADYTRETAYTFDPKQGRNVDGAILALNYHADFADISSVTSYTHKNFNVLWDLDYSPADAVAIEIDRDNRNATKVFTQELRAASNSGGDFDWLIGAYYSQINNRSYALNADLTLGAGASPTGMILQIDDFTNSHTREKQYAAFATVNYNLGNFKLGGGLRVARSENNGVNDNFGTNQNVNETSVLPKMTLGYQVNADTLLYANFAMGMEPGRVNLLSASSATGGDPYRSERVYNYEIGIKGALAGGNLFYEFASYYINYKRRQFESLQFIDVDGDGFGETPLEQILNIGDAVGYGLEGGLTYRPIRALTFAVSGGYLNSKWDDPNAVYRGGNVDNLRTPFSPKFTGNTSIDYNAPIGTGDLEFGARVSASYTGSYYNDPRQFVEQVAGSGDFITTRQRAYTIVNTGISIGNPHAGWQIALRGENIFNKRYYTEFTPDALGRGTARIGQPRAVMGSFSLKF